MRAIIEYPLVFTIGGLAYWCIEACRKFFYTGIFYTSYWMILIGGLAILSIWLINKYVKTTLFQKAVLSAISITGIEFISGSIFTFLLKNPLWTYGTLDILGIISLSWSFLWFILSYIVLVILYLIKNFVLNKRK